MNKGQSIIELLIAIALLAVFLPGLITGLVASRNGKPQQQQRLSATELLQGAEEAVRSVRETGWTAFATDGTFHPVVSGSAWVLASGSEAINGFTRQVVINDVARNSQGAIVTSGGTVDQSTKRVVITISWVQPFASSITTTMYMTRYLDNSVNTQTTQPDFNAGTKSGTSVVATSGSSIPNDGQVQLGSGGGGDWCSPNLSINALDLPGQAYASAISALPGHAYVTTGGNASGDSLDSVNITDPPAPSLPVATNAGSYNNRKTYAVFADNTYAYLTSDHPGLTVDIVALSNLTHAGFFNPSGGGKGLSVYVGSGIGYVTVGNKLFTFDTTTINGSSSQTQLGSITLAGTGNKVVVNGNYAYVAVGGAAIELQVIQVTNGGKSLSIVATGDVNGQAAQDVFVNVTGTRAYLATNFSSTQNDFFVINTTNKSGTLPILGSYGTNGMDPTGLTVVPGNKAIVVGSGGEQYQVIDLTDETHPTRCGGLTSPNGASSVNAIGSVIEQDGDAFSYILTNNASKEFQIIEGGPGGQFTTSGTFESSTFDPGYQAAFNRISATILQPSSTTIQLQVGIANQVGGSCPASFTYLGPDGTANTYFTPSGSTITGTIPFVGGIGNYANPGRCFRYKAFLSTQDNTQTPILYDVTANYSP